METARNECPAALLALEEALLESAEEEEGHPGFLVFWEAARHFVVLGYSKRAEDEVHLGVCRELGVPVLRRASGGGTVLQGPGCLNYTLVLPVDSSPAFETITSTNREVMGRHRKALARISGLDVEIRGHTDLAIQGRKFSGNAQRRRRRCFLFHGAFLLGMDFGLMERALKMPAQQPEYREGRGHLEFLRNLEMPREAVRLAIEEAWISGDGAGPRRDAPSAAVVLAQRLAGSKYASDEWNLKF